MRVVFLGSSDLSIIPLKKIINAGHEIVAVVCQPDKPNARGNKIEISSLKEFAISKNIPVYQFKKIREEGVQVIKDLKADLLIVVYYGQILSQEIINICKLGVINLHPSLLPKYRGPSPVITPILNGEKQTGVTIMRIEHAIDSGNILNQQAVEIYHNETAGELWERLTLIGSDLMIETMDKLEEGKVDEKVQNHSEATFTQMFSKSDAKINFSKSAKDVINHIRAFNPNPGAYFEYNNQRFKVYQAEKILVFDEVVEKESGTILNSSIKEGLHIKVSDGVVNINKIQAPNGNLLGIKEFLNGRSFEIGYVIK